MPREQGPVDPAIGADAPTSRPTKNPRFAGLMGRLMGLRYPPHEVYAVLRPA